MSERPVIRLEGIQPILNVKSIAASKSFYVDILGFSEDTWGDEQFTSLRRDNCGIYLCRGYQGKPGTWLWIGIDGDLTSFYQLLLNEGVNIKMPPTNFSWAQEMHVFDPDGHVLRFGTDPDPTRPFQDEKTNELF
jgi:catechol 2,3-dioxygenase-like lactoylglutathione lyase family enzyme